MISYLKRTAAVVLFVFCYSMSAAAQNAVSEARRALEMLAPLSIEQQGSRLVVTAKERRVTHTIYNAMIYAGICLYAGTGQIKLAGINEIAILNRFRASGWVFEGGAAPCKQISKAPAATVDILIAGHTHLW